MKNKTIVLASNSEHKIKEFKMMFGDYQILSLKDINFFDDIIEDGETFYDNALIKAETIHKFLKEKNIQSMVIADDTGLCVDALGGMPGVYSARYAGNHDNASNRKKLLHELENVKNRSAHFTTMIVRIDPDGKVTAYEGRAEGKILTEEDGSNGFGYDSIFFSDELGKSFGTASSEEKNLVSHRGKAIAKLKTDLEKI
jgi:non-canonical purine NTP pyrophosphatase (RdgB/HAM1 family)